MKKFLTVAILFFIVLIAKGQNLVPNGDFEQYSSCPTGSNQLYLSLPWINPSLTGSPDYFHQCSAFANVPNALWGYQQAHSGNAFSGIDIRDGGITDGREYIEVPLTGTLTPNVCYYFEMYVCLANHCAYTTDDIGVYFSDTLIANIPNYNTLPFTAQINNTSGFITDTLNWTLVSGNYTASGTENYIIIGNFKDDANTDTMLVNVMGDDYAYVYIDDVSLSPCTGIEEQNQEVIKIYPNPVQDELIVGSKQFGEKTEIIITDISGRKVLEEIINNQSSIINLKSFNAGIYFIEINAGKNIYRKKFLKL